MFAKIVSCTLSGVQGIPVDVETCISAGMPYFSIVGLSEGAARQSRERIRSAMKSSGFDPPIQKITINLAPTALRKDGASFDLPIALGILLCQSRIPCSFAQTAMVAGELSLNGELRSIPGVLSMTMCAKERGFNAMILPRSCAAEAALIPGIKVIGASSLLEVVEYLCGFREIAPAAEPSFIPWTPTCTALSLIKGQSVAKRALIAAAAGCHNLLFCGPPGSGKTLLARSLPDLLPPLAFDQALELTQIYSAAGKLPPGRGLMTRRPFLAPHHTISLHAFTGGGSNPRPGVISLAHLGVLFLDELPEFSKHCLEALRLPMEDHSVSHQRLHSSVTFPCDFMLVASMNLCPCGYYPDMTRCTCSHEQVRSYLHRISGPLLDRFDITLPISPIPYDHLQQDDSPSDLAAAQQILTAHEIQRQRFRKEDCLYNSRMPPPLIERYCTVETSGERLLKTAFNHYALSIRAYYAILRCSRTLADLDQSECILERHISEAVQYHSLAFP